MILRAGGWGLGVRGQGPGARSSKLDFSLIRRALPLAFGAGGALVPGERLVVVRNWRVYGEPSGSRDAFLFITGASSVLTSPDPADLDRFLTQTWESFWGRLGWMSLRLPDTWYTTTYGVAAVGLGLSVLALIIWAWRRRNTIRTTDADKEKIKTENLFHKFSVFISSSLPMPAERVDPVLVQGAALFALVAAGVIAGYVQYNVVVNFQAQGRYLFALLLPGALALLGGAYYLLPGRARRLAGAACWPGWG